MILSNRERYFAIGVGAAVAILILNQLVWEPYIALRDRVEADRAQLTIDQNDLNDLFSKERKLKVIWTQMQAGGLQTDASLAASQAQKAVLAWAKNSELNLTALKPERTTREGNFDVMTFQVSGTGPISSISRMLWSLETATIPVHVTELQISPNGKEGFDDLKLQMNISTLRAVPDAIGAVKP